jgi:hypothetical protein
MNMPSVRKSWTEVEDAPPDLGEASYHPPWEVWQSG